MKKYLVMVALVAICATASAQTDSTVCYRYAITLHQPKDSLGVAINKVEAHWSGSNLYFEYTLRYTALPDAHDRTVKVVLYITGKKDTKLAGATLHFIIPKNAKSGYFNGGFKFPCRPETGGLIVMVSTHPDAPRSDWKKMMDAPLLLAQNEKMGD